MIFISEPVSFTYGENMISYNPDVTQQAVVKIGKLADEAIAHSAIIARHDSYFDSVPSRYASLIPPQRYSDIQKSIESMITGAEDKATNEVKIVCDSIMDYSDGDFASEYHKSILDWYIKQGENKKQPTSGGPNGGPSGGGPSDGGESSTDEIPGLGNDMENNTGDTPAEETPSEDNSDTSLDEDKKIEVPFGGNNNYQTDTVEDSSLTSETDNEKLETEDVAGAFADTFTVPSTSMFKETVGENKGIKSGMAAIGITAAAAAAIGGKMYYDKKKDEKDNEENEELSKAEENTGADIETEVKSGLNVVEMKEEIFHIGEEDDD